jgi:hypothetical protein
VTKTLGAIRLKQIKDAKQLVEKVNKIENDIKSIANPSLDGYEKPSETSAVTENDSLQVAIGKIEKALDGKQSAGNYVPVDSPSLTGTPTAPTADAGTNTAQIATTAFVMGALSTLINSAPETLDTLKELAEALGNDPNFSATVMNLIGQKLDKSGGTVTGDLTVSGTITGNVTGNVTGSSGSCTGNAATSTLLYQNDQTAGFKQIAYADYGVNSCGSLRLAFDAYDGSANNETGKFDIDIRGARSRVAVRQFTDWEHYVREATLLDPYGDTYFPGHVAGHRFRGYGGHVAANAMFDNGGITLCEKDGVGSTQTDFSYAPSIGFHWQGVAGGSLSFHRDATFYFRQLDGLTRATVDANLNGNAATATKISGKTIPVVSSFNSTTGVLALTSLS